MRRFPYCPTWDIPAGLGRPGLAIRDRDDGRRLAPCASPDTIIFKRRRDASLVTESAAADALVRAIEPMAIDRVAEPGPRRPKGEPPPPGASGPARRFPPRLKGRCTDPIFDARSKRARPAAQRSRQFPLLYAGSKPQFDPMPITWPANPDIARATRDRTRSAHYIRGPARGMAQSRPRFFQAPSPYARRLAAVHGYDRIRDRDAAAFQHWDTKTAPGRGRLHWRAYIERYRQLAARRWARNAARPRNAPARTGFPHPRFAPFARGVGRTGRKGCSLRAGSSSWTWPGRAGNCAFLRYRTTSTTRRSGPRIWDFCIPKAGKPAGPCGIAVNRPRFAAPRRMEGTWPMLPGAICGGAEKTSLLLTNGRRGTLPPGRACRRGPRWSTPKAPGAIALRRNSTKVLVVELIVRLKGRGLVFQTSTAARLGCAGALYGQRGWPAFVADRCRACWCGGTQLTWDCGPVIRSRASNRASSTWPARSCTD